MPRKKKTEEVSATVESRVEIKVEHNPNVKVVELNGKKYNQIYNPVEGTTSLELLTE